MLECLDPERVFHDNEAIGCGENRTISRWCPTFEIKRNQSTN